MPSVVYLFYLDLCTKLGAFDSFLLFFRLGDFLQRIKNGGGVHPMPVGPVPNSVLYFY